MKHEIPGTRGLIYGIGGISRARRGFRKAEMISPGESSAAKMAWLTNAIIAAVSRVSRQGG